MMQDLYYCQYFKSSLWFSFIVHSDTATTCVNSPILKTVSKLNRKMYLYVPLNPGGCLPNPKFDFYHLWLIWGVQVLKCQIIYKLRECHVLSKITWKEVMHFWFWKKKGIFFVFYIYKSLLLMLNFYDIVTKIWYFLWHLMDMVFQRKCS